MAEKHWFRLETRARREVLLCLVLVLASRSVSSRYPMSLGVSFASEEKPINFDWIHKVLHVLLSTRLP